MTWVNSLIGWQYPEATIKKYIDREAIALLTMDFDYPCQNKCNLKCRYCFVETDEREFVRNKQGSLSKLNIEQLKSIFKDAATLGCKSAKLVGDQEPFQESGFVDFIEFASEMLNMWMVVFTNGSILADESQCLKVHGLKPRELIEYLKKLRVSIMLKFHSFNNDKEDSLVGLKGYAEKRNHILEQLIAVGFNEPPVFSCEEEKLIMTGVAAEDSPTGWTRLGLESVITPQGIDDIEKIYRLKAERRIFVDLDPPVPVGLTRNADWRKRRGLYISKERMLKIAEGIYSLNEELGIPFGGASPYLGGLPCSQLPYGLYINARGRIYPCCGCPDETDGTDNNYLGNVHQEYALIKAIANNPYRNHYKKHGFAYNSIPFNSIGYKGYGIYHGCPFRDRAGDLLPIGWEAKVAEHVQNLRDLETEMKG